MPHLFKIHENFPNLRIVLEHATTRAAVDAVKSLGPTVACTITAHHLALTVDDWAGQGWNFCKPVAKYPDDREALREIVKSGSTAFIQIPIVRKPDPALEGHPRFFLGSDSAPHPPHTKSVATPSQPCAAGVYTSPILLPLVAHLLDSFGALEKLQGFSSTYGRAFYKREKFSGKPILLQRVEGGKAIDESWNQGDQEVVPFWSGKKLDWVIAQQSG